MSEPSKSLAEVEANFWGIRSVMDDAPQGIELERLLVEYKRRGVAEKEALGLLRDLHVALSMAFCGEPVSPEWKTLMARLRAVVGKDER